MCQRVAKRESTSFLLSLASLGLKRLVAIMAEDRQLAQAARTHDSYH